MATHALIYLVAGEAASELLLTAPGGRSTRTICSQKSISDMAVTEESGSIMYQTRLLHYSVVSFHTGCIISKVWSCLMCLIRWATARSAYLPAMSQQRMEPLRPE
jgi:hypothetical protein